jgi:putative DNA primase/helicase
VLTLIGALPETLEDRSILVRMQRKLRSEKLPRVPRKGRLGDPFPELCRKLACLAEQVRARMDNADPDLPETLNDRACDNWRPLVALADLAGGKWPERARASALVLSGGEADTESIGVELLRDVACIFEHERTGRLPTKELIAELEKLDERPWPTYDHGKPINARQMARLLRPFGIKPKTIRADAAGETPKGYDMADLADPIARYVPKPPPASAATPQSGCDKGLRGNVSATRDEAVADEERGEPASDKDCGVVADETPFPDRAHENQRADGWEEWP